MPDGPTVIFIGGWGRTGSTLLARLLATSPGVANVGEINACGAEVYWGTPNAAAGPVQDCDFWSAVFERQASRRQKATQRMDSLVASSSRRGMWRKSTRIPIDRSQSGNGRAAAGIVDEAERRSLSIRARTSAWAYPQISELCSSTSGGRQLPWSMPGPIHRGIARLLSGLMRSRTLAWGERWRTYTRSTSWHFARARVTSSLKG